jgi:hypothetical protein
MATLSAIDEMYYVRRGKEVFNFVNSNLKERSNET